MTDARIAAIRNDKKVGRGSCSRIDECMTDDELLIYLEEDGIKTPEEAVKWAYRDQGLFLEQALNARWGEDDDPQLTAYREWHGDYEF